MLTPRSALLAGALLCAAPLASAKTLIHAGSLIDGRTDAVRKTVTITVEGDRITGLADGFAAPDGRASSGVDGYQAPDDAPAMDRLLGLSGRDPKWSA